MGQGDDIRAGGVAKSARDWAVLQQLEVNSVLCVILQFIMGYWWCIMGNPSFVVCCRYKVCETSGLCSM